MKGPDDRLAVVPLEIRLDGAFRKGVWLCPRCSGMNSSSIPPTGDTIAVCRGCFEAISISAPSLQTPVFTKAWQTVLPGGAKIVIRSEERGGFGYEAETNARVFTASDSYWTRHEAYEAAVRAVKARSRPRDSG